jgi:pimeloyl-ACP methyl ester carboxylesterase
MMKRPLMNPSFLDEEKPQPSRPPRWRRTAVLLGRAIKLLFTDVFRRRKERIRDEVGTPFSRFLKAVLYRLMIVPTILAVLVGVFVVTATHPKAAPAVMDPVSRGVYYDPVEFLSGDNTRLEGWLVPVLDARRLVLEKEDLLHRKYAAIVLVHDFSASRQQVLPLISPLHEAGYVVLAINLRGRGPSANVGSTFGLNESQDVRAAVELLRRRNYVDPDAIGVLGIGTGATAALLAAEQDPRIGALVLDHPVRQFTDVLDARLGPRHPWLAFVRPFCKWTFEIAYKVSGDDLDLSRFSELMKQKPVLMFDEAGETVSCVKSARVDQIVKFLKKKLVVKNKGVSKLLGRPELNVRVEKVDDAPAPAATPAPTQARPPANSNEPSWPPQRSAKDVVEGSTQTNR